MIILPLSPSASRNCNVLTQLRTPASFESRTVVRVSLVTSLWPGLTPLGSPRPRSRHASLRRTQFLRKTGGRLCGVYRKSDRRQLHFKGSQLISTVNGC
jgi:hypothetical protein